MNEEMTATHGLVKVTSTGPVSVKVADEPSATWSLEEVAAMLAASATQTGLVLAEVRVPSREWVEFATISCQDDLVAAVGSETYDAESVLWVCASTLVSALTRYLAEMEGPETPADHRSESSEPSKGMSGDMESGEPSV